jgi:glycosyltransferase involved in cell wall biosynthesis
MKAATDLIPTHQRVESLRIAVQSVQEQTLQDFELFIVGDGASAQTRELASEFCARDDRIRFFDFQKAPGQGELNRHRALQEARTRFVAYLGDDDCWMPGHLAVIDALLAEADFCHTLQVGIDRDRQIVVLPADLQNRAFRERMLSDVFNRFDFTFTGHTLEAYRRLPHGWRTTPAEFPWTDLYMWRQFLAEPWCRVKSAMIPTGINTWSHHRPHLSDGERADDLAYWRGRLADPAFREELWRRIADRFATDAVAFEMELYRLNASTRALAEEHAARAAELVNSRDRLAAVEVQLAQSEASLAQSQAALAQSQVSLAQLQASLAHSRGELARSEASRNETDAALAAARAACEQAQARIAQVEAERAGLAASFARIAGSKSWRYTHPLRLTWKLARRRQEGEPRA